jgi:quinol monooxygenase YgiN
LRNPARLLADDRSVFVAAVVFLSNAPFDNPEEKTMQPTTLINVLTVEPENQPKLLQSLRENTDQVVSTLPGWISTSFIASHDKRRVVIHSQWRDVESMRAMQAHPQMRAYFPNVAALATVDSISGDVAYGRHA